MQNVVKKPVIGITPGDPCGVGPEITIKTLANFPELYDLCDPVVIGDPAVLERAAVCVKTGSSDSGN